MNRFEANKWLSLQLLSAALMALIMSPELSFSICFIFFSAQNKAPIGKPITTVGKLFCFKLLLIGGLLNDENSLLSSLSPPFEHRQPTIHLPRRFEYRGSRLRLTQSMVNFSATALLTVRETNNQKTLRRFISEIAVLRYAL